MPASPSLYTFQYSPLKIDSSSIFALTAAINVTAPIVKARAMGVKTGLTEYGPTMIKLASEKLFDSKIPKPNPRRPRAMEEPIMNMSVKNVSFLLEAPSPLRIISSLAWPVIVSDEAR